MIRRLLTFLTMLIAAAGIAFAGGDGLPVSSKNRGVKLTPEQLKVILAVQPWLGKSNNVKPARSVRSHIAAINTGQKQQPQRLNASGSSIQGWRSVNEYSGLQRGWHELNLDGSEQFLWDYVDPNWEDDGYTDAPDLPFSSGFYRNGEVLGFHSEMLYYWLIWGYGTFDLDGNIKSYQQFGDNLDVTDFSTYVISCAYDPDADLAYAYTINSDASGYLFQKINLESMEFTPICSVNLEDMCLAMAYNPADKRIYALTTNGYFGTLDKENGSFTLLTKYDFPVTTTLSGMTYSPIDKEFVLAYSNPNADETVSVLYTIDPETYALTKVADLRDVVQYRILVTPDQLLDPKAPKALSIDGISFEEGSLSGKVTLTLPSVTYDESPISGELTIAAYLDGKEYSTMSAAAGATVEVPFENIADGMHEFSFVCRLNGLESPAVKEKAFIGYDTPRVPQDISLEAGKLTWAPVTEGVNGGFIDQKLLTYNVYLNGEKLNDEPLEHPEYTFTMPESEYQKYVAEVEADNHGQISGRGVSNNYRYGTPLPMPYKLTPTEDQVFLCEGIAPAYDTWQMGGNDEGDYVMCITYGYDEEEIWFFTPALAMPESDNLIEVSFDMMLDSPFDDSAVSDLAIGYGDGQDEESMQIVKSFTGLNNTSWQRMQVWCRPTADKAYFGFCTRHNENGAFILLRNIEIKESDRPGTTPDIVTDLTMTALPKGENAATVSFTMPVKGVSGAELTDATLTATVTSPAETKTVTGAPGSKQSVQIATTDGWNTVKVHADNNAEGLETEGKNVHRYGRSSTLG